ncbi:Zn-ribbon domain-containing OB-fold protein [Streptomyces ureilyticus]|uniref:DNA-binding protein n=1 Tax=Streptomyces ureilyticus TaxID=1775131 RepID=A0ABX0DSN8_9ACTN|nr:OB-fold domain-containing protein [Streptomyces ureilyticus]NGO42166.1 hypothetical protein [Streptomyces ureilyticus]
MMQQKPVADGLFTWPPTAQPRLIGTECTACGLVSFPTETHCVRCGSPDAKERLLADSGTLWTFSTQGFRPPSPPYDGSDTAATFEPYAVGYVELPGEVLVEARLTEPDPEKLTIGQRMRLTLVPYTVDADGTEVLTFAFTPADEPNEPVEANEPGQPIAPEEQS